MKDLRGEDMTREEREAAISYLETYRKSDEELFKLSPQNSVAHHAAAQCLKYWDMAIESLKQEPTTKNCGSCRYYGSHHEVCNYCYKCSLWTEQEPTTKNDLGVDCISRQAVIDMTGLSEWFDSSDSYNEFVFELNTLPSVTPQEPVLDKIRAEIEQSKRWRGYSGNPVIDQHDIGLDRYFDRGLDKALAIIDKYKAESEDKE